MFERSAAVLDTVSHLVRLARDRPHKEVSVVPALVDELAQVEAVFTAVADHSDLSFISADRAVAGAPPKLTTNAHRRAALEQLLTETDIELEIVADELRLVGQPDLDVAPDGHRALLGALRALFHERIDDSQVTVVFYDAHKLDLDAAALAWKGAHRQHGLPTTGGNIIVVVSNDALDFASHCDRRHGVRCVLRDTRSQFRNDPSDLGARAASLLTHQGPVVMFLGAGFTASSKLPLGNTLRDEAIRRILDGMNAGHSVEPLPVRFHRWAGQPQANKLNASEQAMTRDEFARTLTLEQVVRIETEIMSGYPTLTDFKQLHDGRLAAPGQAVVDLADLLRQRPNCFVLVTVNFDEFVETHADDVRVFISDADFGAFPSYLSRYLAGDESAVPLLKLHGTISDPSSCVITSNATSDGVPEPVRAALLALTGGQDKVPWYYIGASMRDRDLLPVFAHGDFAGGVDEHWVGPLLDEGVESFGQSRDHHWSGPVEQRLITETADSFFAAIRERL